MNTNPTDLGWREPWRPWGVSAAPWNGGPAEVGPLVWKASEQLLEVLGIPLSLAFHNPPSLTAIGIQSSGLGH